MTKFLRSVIGSMVFSSMVILVMIHGWGFLIIAGLGSGYLLYQVAPNMFEI